MTMTEKERNLLVVQLQDEAATPNMTLDFFQRTAHKTAIWVEKVPEDRHLDYLLLGLTEEAGECAGKLKKLMRDHEGEVTPEFKEAMRKELGDVLWYLAETAGYLGVNLSEVAAGNLLKVLDRKARGTLGGSGDNR